MPRAPGPNFLKALTISRFRGRLEAYVPNPLDVVESAAAGRPKPWQATQRDSRCLGWHATAAQLVGLHARSHALPRTRPFSSTPPFS